MVRFVRLRRLVLAAAAALPPVAAGAQAPVVVGQSFLADGLDPAQGANGWALQAHGLAETLFTVDREGRLVPQLARSIAREGASWRLALRPGLTFSDGSPLDAAAAAAALARSIAANPRAAAQTGRLDLAILDPVTLRLTPERPVPVMDAVLAEYPLAIYRQAGDGFVFTGPYQVAEFRRGDWLRLLPNPRFRESADRPPVTIRRVADPQTLALGLEGGELDLAFGLATETLPRLARRARVVVKSTPVAYQYMMFLNTARPPLDDPRVRRAVDLALDRAQLVQALGAGEVATGMYPTFFPFAARAPRPFDPAAAARLLDEAGWRRERDGARRRDGRALEVTLVTYPQRPDLVTLAPVAKAQLEAAGLRVRVETTEAITPALQGGRFDLGFWAMHAAPGGDGGFVLEQYFRGGAALNFSAYASARFDAALDTLRDTDGAGRRIDLLRAAQEILFEDAPVAFLLTPVWHVGLSARLSGYVPYPSDYYIVRPDLTGGR